MRIVCLHEGFSLGKIVAYLQFLLVRGFCLIVNLLPEVLALWVGRGLGILGYYVVRERRKVALENLRLAFGRKWPEREIRSVAKRVFGNLGMTAVEFFRMPGMTQETLRQKVEIEGLEVLRQVLDNSSGGFLLLAHLGNWELMAPCGRVLGLPVSVVAKPIKKNPWLDRWVKKIREGAGLEVIETDGASKKLLRALSKGRWVGILVDQRAKRREAVWVDFFGKKAPTTPALSVLAMRTGAPVVPAFMVRKEKGKHLLLFKEPIKIVDTGDIKKDMEANTLQMTQILESMIRQYPDQWFWVHRRWERRKKSRP